jgi:N-carbamoyl-L-amino-acid hydrolase
MIAATELENWIDSDRLWRNLLALAELTDPDAPYTRRCFTDHFLVGRHWLAQRFEDAGLSCRVDPGGNIIGRREGLDPSLAALAIGSHTDTVPSGGRFDGILGVLAALEVAQSLHDRRVLLNHPLEIIDFLGEEPNDYGVSCVGSRAMTGHLTAVMLELTNTTGETLSAAMARMGASPRDYVSTPSKRMIAAFLELHIEQAECLERGEIDVGIVTGIAGILRVEIIFRGSADHAGTTPYKLRRDALLAAAETVRTVRYLGEAVATETGHFFITTTGVLELVPNAANVVPGQTRLVIEARADHDSDLDVFLERLSRVTRSAADTANVNREAFRILSRSRPAPCDPALRRHREIAATSLSLSTTDLASGAGHDSAFMATMCPTAMIFVPSSGGRSHCPEEWTDKDACANGSALLLQAIRSIDETSLSRGLEY